MSEPYGDSADYSRAYQDEYQRLWHEAAAERDVLREALRRSNPDAELRLVQIAADRNGLVGLDRDGRVWWQDAAANAWKPISMNVSEERKETP